MKGCQHQGWKPTAYRVKSISNHIGHLFAFRIFPPDFNMVLKHLNPLCLLLFALLKHHRGGKKTFPVYQVFFCSAMRLHRTQLVLHTQGCVHPLPLASRPWNAELHIFPFSKEKQAFQSQSARNVALFLFSTELPGTYYVAVRDVYLAMVTRGLFVPLRHWSCHLG